VHCFVLAGLAIGCASSWAVLDEAPGGLSGAGLTIMVCSIGGVLTLVLWSYSKLLRAPPRREDDL
jgi:hypothetical protein